MKYELTNRYYGHKKIAPSEKAKDRILAQAKVDPKDNLPVWEVTREIPDTPVQTNEEKLREEIEALKAQLAEAGEKPAEVETKAEPQPKAVARKAPPKKTAKKLGDKGSSI